MMIMAINVIPATAAIAIHKVLSPKSPPVWAAAAGALESGYEARPS